MAHLLVKVGAPILVLGLLIFIHELGHFLTAKLFNVKVLRFSIGFGPKLFGFTRGETEYQLAAVPLGGYVKMAGDDPTEPVRPEDQGRGFLEQAPWKRALIALAGPFTNLAFPVLIYFCVFYFQTQALSARVGAVAPESPAYAAGIRPGDRIVAIDGHTVRYFNDLRDLVGPKWDQDVRIEYERPDGSHVAVNTKPERAIQPGVLHGKPLGRLGISAQPLASDVAVLGPTTPAGQAGLKTFDRITAIAGAPVKTFDDVERLVAKQTGPFDVAYLRSEPLPAPGAGLSTPAPHTTRVTPLPGKTLAERVGLGDLTRVVGSLEPSSPAATAGLQRGDELLSANGKPLLAWSTLERVRDQAKLQPIDLEVRRDGQVLHLKVTQVSRTVENERGKEESLLYFGAQPADNPTSGELVPIHHGVVGSVQLALRIVPEVISDISEGLWGLISNQIALKTVGGPATLFDIAAKSAEAGWDSFLNTLAFLSVNLGVMNLVPIPVLDGFHVLSSGFEWVRRRPLSLRAREVANIVGLVMLLMLMAVVLKNEFIKYVLN